MDLLRLRRRQAKTDDKKAAKTGDTTVIAYEGNQNWPTGESAEILKDYAVPVYKGLPNKSYKVLGRIVDERAGVEEIGKAFEDTFGGQKHRIRDCANQAKLQGGDALLVTDDERVLKALNLTRKPPRPCSTLGPLHRAASPEQTAAHDQQCAELARYKLYPISRPDPDGYHRTICPAAQGKIRCPHRPHR